MIGQFDCAIYRVDYGDVSRLQMRSMFIVAFGPSTRLEAEDESSRTSGSN